MHVDEFFERGRAEILLIDDAVLADDEGLHAGDAIFGRSRHQSEAADHRAFHHVIELAERSGRSLSL